MDDLSLLIDLHKDGARQGPGGEAQTLRALATAGLTDRQGLVVADLGCGTGAASLILAQHLSAQVLAVDLFPAFLAVLKERAASANLSPSVAPIAADIAALPFADGSLDAIVAEGAIYNVGFETGIRAWRPRLKPGGMLIASDLTFFTETRPQEVTDHWLQAYPGAATASHKLQQLEAAGYAPRGYFTLPTTCWLDNYYRPLEARMDEFLARHGHSAPATAIAKNEADEIALFERYHAFFGYGVYIASKTGD